MPGIVPIVLFRLNDRPVAGIPGVGIVNRVVGYPSRAVYTPPPPPHPSRACLVFPGSVYHKFKSSINEKKIQITSTQAAKGRQGRGGGVVTVTVTVTVMVTVAGRQSRVR